MSPEPTPSQRERLAAAVLGGTLVLAALGWLAPRYVYHWDEVQLTLAIRHFDLAWHHPQPPGYYLFVILSRLAAPFVSGDAPPGRLVSSLFAGLGMASISWLLPRGLGRAAHWLFTLAAAAFFVLSPLVWFYAEGSLTYVAEGVVWLWIAAAIAARPQGRRLLLGAFLVGLCAGLRQTLALWSASLVLVVALRDRSWIRARQLPALALAFACGVAVWLGPMVVETGGWSIYWQASRLIVFRNIWSKSVFAAAPLGVLSTRLPLMAGDVALGLGPWLGLGFAVALLRFQRRFAPRLRPLDPILLSAALAFVFYLVLLYATSGYALSVVVPCFAFALLGAARMVAGRSPSRAVWGAGAVALGAVALQLWLPGGHLTGSAGRLGERRQRDQILSARFDAIRQAFSPESTVLATRKETWEFAFRHVMFYLPEFPTIQIMRDPLMLGLSDGQPFLTAQNQDVWASGPDGLTLDRLARLDETRELRTVVFMQPAQAVDAFDPSCRPLGSALRTSAGELLPFLRVPPAVRVLARSGRLYCVSAPL